LPLVEIPIEGNSQQIPQQVIRLPDRPLLGPPRPDKVTNNSTLMEAMLKNLLRMVHRQTSIIEEQEIQSTIFFKKDLTYMS
jgi:hypothetical protein